MMEILTGWHLLTEGPALAGDKYWNAAQRAWLPVTVNTFKDAADFVAVIRKSE